MLDIASLAHALLQPDDRAAWLAVLRAPWCALALPDLFALAAACGKRSLCEAIGGACLDEVLPRLSPHGRARFERFAAVVAAALAQRGRLPLVAWLRGVWLALGGPACVNEAIDLAAAERVFALLHEHALGSDLPDWAGFTAALHTLYAEAEADAATRVRVMTLHRAKGLEFDVVVMPGLARKPPPRVAQLLLWREAEAGLLLAPIRARTAANREQDPVYAYLRRARRQGRRGRACADCSMSAARGRGSACTWLPAWTLRPMPKARRAGSHRCAGLRSLRSGPRWRRSRYRQRSWRNHRARLPQRRG